MNAWRNKSVRSDRHRMRDVDFAARANEDEVAEGKQRSVVDTLEKDIVLNVDACASSQAPRPVDAHACADARLRSDVGAAQTKKHSTEPAGTNDAESRSRSRTFTQLSSSKAARPSGPPPRRTRARARHAIRSAAIVRFCFVANRPR